MPRSPRRRPRRFPRTSKTQRPRPERKRRRRCLERCWASCSLPSLLSRSRSSKGGTCPSTKRRRRRGPGCCSARRGSSIGQPTSAASSSSASGQKRRQRRWQNSARPPPWRSGPSMLASLLETRSRGTELSERGAVRATWLLGWETLQGESFFFLVEGERDDDRYDGVTRKERFLSLSRKTKDSLSQLSSRALIPLPSQRDDAGTAGVDEQRARARHRPSQQRRRSLDEQRSSECFFFFVDVHHLAGRSDRRRRRRRRGRLRPRRRGPLEGHRVRSGGGRDRRRDPEESRADSGEFFPFLVSVSWRSVFFSGFLSLSPSLSLTHSLGVSRSLSLSL